MNRYDIIQQCPSCGEVIHWVNGQTNNGIVYIKTKRKTVLLFHAKCIEKENMQNGHIKSEKW